MHWAEAYIGLPWKTGGRDPETGVDCWGLLCHFYRTEYGIDLSPIAAPVDNSGMLTATVWAPTDSPQEGDAVALGRGGKFSHAGVYTDLGESCILHIQHGALSSITPIERLCEMGYNTVNYYRHVERTSNH